MGRLDNLAMSYCAARALVDSFPDETSLQGQDAVKAVALFDHEEVGSASAQGKLLLRNRSKRQMNLLSGRDRFTPADVCARLFCVVRLDAVHSPCMTRDCCLFADLFKAARCMCVERKPGDRASGRSLQNGCRVRGFLGHNSTQSEKF